MTIKSSGSSLSFSEIAAEFGSPTNKNLGAYRVSQRIDNDLKDLPLDSGIPQSGQIKFSDFYSKKLNIVVDCNATQSVKTRQRYIDGYYTVIGGFRSGPSNTSGTKVTLYVNTTINSTKGDRSNSAINIGATWDSGTDVTLNVGPSGGIYGSGGDGGPSPRYAGSNGTTAITVRYPCTILNRGYIQAGYGGGGGGSGWSQDRQVQTGSGGGGKKSDIRLKTNIQKLNNVLDKIMNI